MRVEARLLVPGWRRWLRRKGVNKFDLLAFSACRVACDYSVGNKCRIRFILVILFLFFVHVIEIIIN